MPDIVVEKTDEGEYDVRLIDDWMPNIYISRRYMSCITRTAHPTRRRASILQARSSRPSG